MYKTIDLPDDTDSNNLISVELYHEQLDLTAEWAGDIYGEGQLTLSLQQAKMLFNFLKEHLEN